MVSLSSFIVHPTELQGIQRRLHLAPSPSASVISSASTTKTHTHPTALPLSPSDLKSSDFWLHDERLPKTVRTAIRAGLYAALLNSTLTGVGEGLRKRSLLAALRRMLSRTSFQLFVSVFAFSALYRMILQAALLARQQLLHNLFSRAPRQPHQSLSEGQEVEGLEERTLRARLFYRVLRIAKANGTIPAIAAILASPALALLPDGDFPTISVAMYCFAQSIAAIYSEARAAGSRLVSWVPDWCDSGLLYAIGNGQLLWAFLFENHAFPKAYGNIILARSSAYIPRRPHQLPDGVDWPSGPTIADHVAILATPTPTTQGFPSFTSPVLSSLTPSKHPASPYQAINPIFDYSPAHPAHTSLMCAMLHPTEPSCKTTLLNHFKAEWTASARFAGLFALLASVVFRRGRWIKAPETELFNIVVATLQGATVISGSIGTAWAMTCFLQQYLPRTFLPRSRFFLNGLVSGIWILAVPKNRRRELGLYVARMSAMSSWKILEKQGRVKSVPFGSRLLLAFALSMMACLYESNAQHTAASIKALSRRVFGDKLAQPTLEKEE